MSHLSPATSMGVLAFAPTLPLLPPIHKPSLSTRRPPTAALSPPRPLVAAAAALLLAFTPPSHAFTTAPMPGLTPSETRVVDLFNKSTASVVNVATFSNPTTITNRSADKVPGGAGSGFVYEKDGNCYIITNFHVIRGSSGARVILANQKSFNASLKGYDGDKDIAVLELVDAKEGDLVPISIGTSKGLVVGQSTYAIGNPFGLDHSLTSGVLSGLGRQMKSPTGRLISNVIQTDAATNPGNSGGPLLNSAGQVIGMNTSIYSSSGTSAGIGFAIPADTILQIADSLILNGRIVRPVLGITYLESAQARAVGIDKGVLVLGVQRGGGAEKAGVVGMSRVGRSGEGRRGDVVESVDGVQVGTEADLFQVLEAKKVGDKVTLVVENPVDGRRSVIVKLGASKASD